MKNLINISSHKKTEKHSEKTQNFRTTRKLSEKTTKNQKHYEINGNFTPNTYSNSKHHRRKKQNKYFAKTVFRSDICHDLIQIFGKDTFKYLYTLSFCMDYRLSTVISREDKFFVAKGVEIELVSQGKTVEEALENLKEAFELWIKHAELSELEVFEKVQSPIITQIEVAT